MAFFLFGLPTLLFALSSDPKVVLIVIDGVRYLELEGKATDDEGNSVSAESLFPNLMRLKKQGLFLPEMRISNPAGISLPAYSDIIAGRRQEKIVTNEPPKKDLRSHYPTLFQTIKQGLNLPSNGIALIASWKPICDVAVMGKGSPESDFYMSCGWKKEKSFKPEIFPGSRSDMDTYIEFVREVPVWHPRFVFVHFGDADEEAHFHQAALDNSKVYYGIIHYHNALRQIDYYVGRIWKLLQEDPFYRDSTTLIITTDHGRDNIPDPKQWADHGACRKHRKGKLCDACQQIFGLAVGPGVTPRVVNTRYTHIDLAPTISRIFGLDMPSSKGKLIKEMFNPDLRAEFGAR